MGQDHLAVPQKTVLPTWLVASIVTGWLALVGGLILTPGVSLLGRLRWLDSGICAQLLTHSFYPGGERLPLCARNTGIYLSFSVTLIVLHLLKRGRAQRLPPKAVGAVLICGVVALVIDGMSSFLLDIGFAHFYQPQNTLRLASGLVSGFALAVFALPLLNRLCWRDFQAQRSIVSWKELICFLPLLLLCFWAVASQTAIALYPVAILSTAGFVSALGSFNLAIIGVVSKRDESFERYSQILPFFSLALLLAIGEMLALAQIKLLLLQALGV